MKTSWQIRRTGVTRCDGARRWDDAYHFLLRWAEAAGHCAPGAKALGQIPPGSSGAEDLQNAVEDATMIDVRPCRLGPFGLGTVVAAVPTRHWLNLLSSCHY
jgi:hypothetical protein